MAPLIHVDAQREPATFDATVRQKGLAFLQSRSIAPDEPLAAGTDLSPYWRDCLQDLYAAYAQTCAYLGVFFEMVVGGATVDHYVAKSRRPALAYEWSNYRLACSRMNTRKRDYEDVLDPFEVEDGWFRLELVTGRVHLAPGLPEHVARKVKATIRRLGLDDAGNREMRARHYREYRELALPHEFLKRMNPFLWHEANRQGLL